MTGFPGAVLRLASLAVLGLFVVSCSDSTGPSVGPPAAIEVLAGGNQVASVTTTLPVALRVRVVDAQARGVKRVAVTWTVQAGGGTLQGAAVQTAADGTAQATWLLGPTAGAQRVSVSVAGVAAIEIVATASAGAAAAVVAQAGNGQSATSGTVVAVPPAVLVRDAHGNPVAGAAVTCTVTAGGGTVTGGAATTGADGIGAVESWQLGTTAGVNELSCSSGAFPPVRFTATGTPGAPATMLAHAGTGQSGLVGTAVPVAPAVLLRDVHGNAVAGVAVTFAVTAGGGSVSGGNATTDGTGVARVGAWTLGASPGPNTLSATAAGVDAVLFSADAEPMPDMSLSVKGVHLNQGSQSDAGTIGGVAGRPALLRVMVRASVENTFTPPVRVRLYDGATLLREELIPAPGTGVPTDPDLNLASDTWNLELSADEVVAGLSVEAIVDPDNALPGDSAVKRWPRGGGTASLDVQPMAPLRIMFIPIHATVQNTTGSITAANATTFLRSVQLWIPSGGIEPTIRDPYTTSLDLSVGSNWSVLLQEVQAVRTAEAAQDEYYHGIIGDFPTIPYGGLGYVPGSVGSGSRSALSYDRSGAAPATIAHELGHNLGRPHAPCGNPANPDPGYPYPNAVLGAPGYDILAGALRHEAAYRDFMSYCGPEWTSDYTFERILQWRRSDPYAQFGVAQSASAAAAPQPGLLVWGSMRDGDVTLNPAFALEARPVLPATSGRNLLRGLAADGRELFRISFEGVPVGDSADPDERHFAFFVPLGAQRDDVARLELTTPRGNAVRTARPETPGVARARPAARLERAAGTRVRVRWNAEEYPLALVRDAATGRVLSFARRGDALIETRGLGAARLEVLLSDGVRSARAAQ